MCPIQAMAKDPHNLPQEVLAHIQKPIKQGQATLTVFFMDIYDGDLWVEQKNEAPKTDLDWLFSQKFSLTLFYNRDITQKELTDYSISELRRYYSMSNEQEQTYRKKFNMIFLDIKKNDRISALFNPETGLNFTLNGRDIGNIPDLDLAVKYINIWVHPNANYQRFRKKILGVF